MARAVYLTFGIVAYLIFFATFLYLIVFLADLPGMPRTVDHGPVADIAHALVVDIGLIAVFGLQHSIMARQGFKRVWTRIVPQPIERSAYVFIASLILGILFHFWLPIPGVIWRVDNGLAAGFIWSLFGSGWLIVLLSTFLISHFELFGLSQVYRHLRGAPTAAQQFRQPFFYRLVRHPLYTGFLIAFWATPVMTQGHLLFAAGMTVYIVIAIRYEERDMVDAFGKDYRDYQASVGMLVPGVGTRPGD